MQCSDRKGEQKLRESKEILIDDGRAEGEAGGWYKKGGRKRRGIAGIHSCAFYNHTILRKSVLPRQTTNGEKQGRGEGERGNHVKSPKVRARREERKRGTVEVRNADEV